MIAGDWDPAELPPPPMAAPVNLPTLRTEAEAAAAVDPIARLEWDRLSEEEQGRAIRDSAAWRAGVEASARRAGFDSIAEYLNVVDPVPARRADADALPPFPEPEDRGTATLSPLGDVETVGDIGRPGRIATVAAEEGSGKSFLALEMAVRVAVAGGSFAGTWPVLRTGPVLYLSEMHSDDDYGREATVLDSLGLERSALTGRYYRLPLMTAAGGRPALMVPEWRAWVTGWLRDHGALLLIVDTATGATQVDPWGREIQAVYAGLRVMLNEYPDLAIVLLIHLKKPQGRGERRISDVLGEWGRWCDVVILMENDGNGLTRARLTVRKRVRHERRIVVTKAGGLLVDPVDAVTTGPKIPADKVVAAVAAQPGLTYAELGAALGVSKRTASNYVTALADRLDTVKGNAASGPGASVRVYPSRIAQDRETGTLRDPLAMEGGSIAHRAIAYIEGDALARSPATSADLEDPPSWDAWRGDGDAPEERDLKLSTDWPKP